MKIAVIKISSSWTVAYLFKISKALTVIEILSTTIFTT